MENNREISDESEKQKGMKEWNEKKKELFEELFNEIDLNSIEKIFEYNYYDIINRKEYESEFSKIFTYELGKNKIILEKCNLIVQNTKNEFNGNPPLNFVVAGLTGAGKSTLIRGIQDEMYSYSNTNKYPGLKLYDTIPMEVYTEERNLREIKEMIKEKFDENSKNPEKNLNGILYCIKNGMMDIRFNIDEIRFITELNKLYGDGDNFIIVFTQSVNEKTEKRKELLKESLNNPNIEIIDVLAKDIYIHINNDKLIIKSFGVDKLIDTIVKKCQKQSMKYTMEQIVKANVKRKYLASKSGQIKRKINEYKFEKTFNEECKYILNYFIGDISDLNLNFECFDNLISKTMEDSKKVMKKKLIEENKEKWENKLKKEFNIINNNFNKQLDDSSITNDMMEKFDEFFSTKIEEYIRKIVFRAASQVFAEEVEQYFERMIFKNFDNFKI